MHASGERRRGHGQRPCDLDRLLDRTACSIGADLNACAVGAWRERPTQRGPLRCHGCRRERRDRSRSRDHFARPAGADRTDCARPATPSTVGVGRVGVGLAPVGRVTIAVTKTCVARRNAAHTQDATRRRVRHGAGVIASPAVSRRGLRVHLAAVGGRPIAVRKTRIAGRHSTGSAHATGCRVVEGACVAAGPTVGSRRAQDGLAPVSRVAVAVTEACAARRNSAGPQGAARRRVRQRASAIARSAVSHRGLEVDLTAVRGDPITVAESYRARETTRSVGACRHRRHRRHRARRTRRPA